MNRYYYLHVWALIGHDVPATPTTNAADAENRIVEAIVMDAWPADALFSFSPFFFVSEHLKAVLESCQFSGLTFHKISTIRQGSNFRANFPDANVPNHYWQMQITGSPGMDDFFTLDKTYLVVSKAALKLLRAHGVTNAEADLIDIPFEQYFGSGRKYFWMEEKVQAYFIQMDAQKKQ